MTVCLLIHRPAFLKTESITLLKRTRKVSWELGPPHLYPLILLIVPHAGFCLRDELSEVKLLLESSSDGDPEERFTAVHRRYHLLARDYKRLEKRLVECQRKQIEVAQHRDIIQNEYSRTNLAKTKLESLCRELQRHSKAVAVSVCCIKSSLAASNVCLLVYLFVCLFVCLGGEQAASEGGGGPEEGSVR